MSEELNYIELSSHERNEAFMKLKSMVKHAEILSRKVMDHSLTEEQMEAQCYYLGLDFAEVTKILGYDAEKTEIGAAEAEALYEAKEAERQAQEATQRAKEAKEKLASLQSRIKK